MKFAKSSLKFSIIKRLSIVFIVSFIIIGLTLSLVERNLAKDKLVADLNVIGQILANRTMAALIFNDVKAAETNLSAAKYHKTIEQICLFNKNGDFFTFYSKQDIIHNCSENNLISSHSSHEFTKNHLTLYIPIIDQDESLGALIIRSNLNYIQTYLNYVIIILAGILLFALLMVYLITNQLLKRLLSPLQHLHATAQHLTKNVFSDIRAQKTKNDEVGELVDVFNNMLDSLADEHHQLQYSEERFRTLAENAPIGIFLRDENDTYLFVNQRWQDMTNCHLPLTNQTYSKQIDKKDLLRVSQVLSNAKESGQPAVIEYKYISASGATKTFLEQLAPIHLNQNKFAGYIGSVLDITELKQARHELEKLAFHDPLTGLANRRFFNDHLQLEVANAAKLDQTMAVLMLDLDHFKRVNDSLGHEIGDELLKTVAAKLTSIVSPEDLVSRMGGDEFMILIRDAAILAQLDKLINAILVAIVTPMPNQSLLDVTASIGVSVYPKDGESGAELIRNADIALYKAKDYGRNQVVYFSYVLDAEIKDKIRLEQKLRKAVSKNQLEVYLQPQFNTQSGRFFWAEALIRWFDDEDGFIPPDKFIGLAEDTGLIHEVSLFVLEQVCIYLVEHKTVFSKLGIQGISVNLSANQFFAKHFLSDITRVIKQYNIAPGQLEFELTESVVMEDIAKAINIMQSLRNLGCRLSIDDFGTGYSSLAYLKQFPIHSFKIDRTFIRDIPNNKQDIAIATAIIAMSQKLGLEIIAEGVETQAQSDFLAQQGCYCIQGYFYARPMPINQLIKLAD